MDRSKELYMAGTKPASLTKAFWLYGVGYLSILYLASFLAIYTPIGRILGVPLHIGLSVPENSLGCGLSHYFSVTGHAVFGIGLWG